MTPELIFVNAISLCWKLKNYECLREKDSEKLFCRTELSMHHIFLSIISSLMRIKNVIHAYSAKNWIFLNIFVLIVVRNYSFFFELNLKSNYSLLTLFIVSFSFKLSNIKSSFKKIKFHLKWMCIKKLLWEWNLLQYDFKNYMKKIVTNFYKKIHLI